MGGKGPICAALLAMGALLAGPTGAGAATITVNTTDDGASSGCTLRDAITAANDNTASGNCAAGDPAPTVDTIHITATGMIAIASALPVITEDVRIKGPGADSLSVSGQSPGGYPDMRVGGGTDTISGLTLESATIHGTNTPGGGFVNFGTATLKHVRVFDNSIVHEDATNGQTIYAEGAGIYNNGTLTLDRSEVIDNSVAANEGGLGASRANAWGAGIQNDGDLTLRESTVSANNATAGDGSTDANARAFAYGAGIYNLGTSLTVERSTVDTNNASASETSTASGSSAWAYGGGIALDSPTTITESTIADNSATATGGVIHPQAGGIANGGGSGTITAKGDTIAFNNSAGVANFVSDSNIGDNTFKDTIVSDPQGGGVNCDSATFITSNGFNLEDGSAPGTCGFTQATDRHGNPALKALASNGGPTTTLALGKSSAARDAGLTPAGETTDQRGLPRPVDFFALPNAAGGDGSDIGAFEYQGPSCQGKPATIVATPGKTTRGTGGADVIAGTGGKDKIESGGGNDLVCGGDGDDTISGGAGNDRLYGQAGDDLLDGGPGHDTLKSC